MFLKFWCESKKYDKEYQRRRNNEEDDSNIRVSAATGSWADCVKPPFVDGGHRPEDYNSRTAYVQYVSRSGWKLVEKVPVLYLFVFLSNYLKRLESTFL